MALGESAQQILNKRSAQAAANRAAMPIVTAAVDDFKRAGLDPRVTFAQEGDRRIGKPDERRGVEPVIEPRALARKDDPGTSKAAAEKAAGFAEKHESMILHSLHYADFTGLTAKEIGDKTGLTDVQVSRRVAGMIERGFIRRNGAARGGCAVLVVC